MPLVSAWQPTASPQPSQCVVHVLYARKGAAAAQAPAPHAEPRTPAVPRATDATIGTATALLTASRPSVERQPAPATPRCKHSPCIRAAPALAGLSAWATLCGTRTKQARSDAISQHKHPGPETVAPRPRHTRRVEHQRVRRTSRCPLCVTWQARRRRACASTGPVAALVPGVAHGDAQRSHTNLCVFQARERWYFDRGRWKKKVGGERDLEPELGAPSDGCETTALGPAALCRLHTGGAKGHVLERHEPSPAPRKPATANHCGTNLVRG